LLRSRSRSARFDFLERERATSRDVNYKREINNPPGTDLLRRGTRNRRAAVVIRLSRERKAITGCNPRDARRYRTEI
jgi:hypothetical protein